MTQLVDNKWPSSLVRRIGYCLLVLALLDVINIIIPPRVTDPTWQFQTVGTLVERITITFLGLVLVFYGESDLRLKRERVLLKFLSWAAMLVGILFLLLAPFLISTSLRVDDIINYQINTQVTQQLSGLEQLEKQIGQAATVKEMNNVTARLNIQMPPDVKNFQQLKSQLLTQVVKTKETVRPKVEAAWQDKRFGLLKSSIKWFIACIIIGSVFVYTWHVTRWARLDSRWSR